MSNFKGYLKDKNGNKIYPDEYDTGWIDLSPLLMNGFQAHQIIAFPPSYRKVGNQVFLRGLLVNKTNSSSGKICVIPYHPTTQLFFIVSSTFTEDSNNRRAVQLSIYPDGSMYPYGNTIEQTCWFSLDGISYFID